MNLFGVQKSKNFVCFNADVKAQAYGPSVADIRNTEVQKSAVAQPERSESVRSSEMQDDAAEDDEQAA